MNISTPVAGIVSVALSLILASCSEEQANTKVSPKPILWIKTQQADLSQVRRISGVLQAAESADLSFEVSGKVKSVFANLGDAVNEGDVLAELDEASYELTKKSAAGGLQEANAIFVEAQNEFRRQSNLYEDGWVSKAAFDSAKAALDTARSGVAVATAQLDLTQEDLVDTALRAPYDGKIVARLIEPSQTVRAGETIIQIEGYNGLEVSVLVPETIIGSLARGQRYKTHYPVAPEVSLEAEISEIGSRAEIANAFRVTLLLQDANEGLRAGMTAEVDFTFLGRSSAGDDGVAIKIPPTAVLPGADQKSYAYVYDEIASVVRKREILVENVIGNEILISNGLLPGEIIAIAGVEYLNDGELVRLFDVGVEQFN
ncbi:MAG: efflux RND transporter periplasmic adaptor subunit [Pseudomonadota bacterium]